MTKEATGPPVFRAFEGWASWEQARAGLADELSPPTLGRLDEAFRFAADCHGGQVRPGGEPYIEHLLEVLDVLARGAGVKEADTLVAALLHDVVEDTDCALIEVESRFGSRVSDLVQWLTKGEPEEGETATAARSRYLERLGRAPAAARSIKLADRLSNVQRLDTHPRAEKRRSYYEETVATIVPLAAGDPWFERQYDSWRAAFRHLGGGAEGR